MAVADNKELFRRYLHALSHPELLDSVLALDFVAYDLPEGSRDRASLRLFRERANQTISDPVLTVDYLVAEDDLVAAHMTATLTWAPTGERFTSCIMEIVGIKDNKIAWRRAAFDSTGHGCANEQECQDPHQPLHLDWS
jgi:SnoaL-like polyketide cyclase